jgi:hypothetical protein
VGSPPRCWAVVRPDICLPPATGTTAVARLSNGYYY